MSDQETLIFQTKLYQWPQINLARVSIGRMWAVSGCALLGILQSSLSDHCYSLFLASLLALAGALTEFAFNLIAGNSLKDSLRFLKDGSGVTSALVFTLLLPNQIHPLPAVLSLVLGMAMVKHSFGGLGANWLNPALGAWLLLKFTWPLAFAEALEGDAQSFWGLELGVLNGIPALFESLDEGITFFLNRTIFALPRAELPPGYLGLLLSTGNGAIADRGLLALFLGSIVLVGFGIGRFWMSALFFGLYALALRFLGSLPAEFGAGDALLGLFSGAAVTAGFFMLTDPATGPKSNIGAVIIAAIAGIGAFIFRVKGEPYGACYAIGIANGITPLIRNWESSLLYRAPSKRNRL